MSTTATLSEPVISAPAEDRAFEYRALHTGAIMGLVLGVLSVFTVITAASSFEACLMVCPIPLIGIFVSLRAWSAIAGQPDQFTGRRLAQAGFALSLVFLVTGVGYGGYVYATEVPDGYTRISFTDLKPDEIDERAGRIVPEEIKALDGQKVFIKGYMRPGSTPVRNNIDQFLLVRDSNECCFGDLSKVKYYDQMAVTMQGSLRVDYASRLFRMGGTLRIHPENLLLGPGSPVFSLEADYRK